MFMTARSDVCVLLFELTQVQKYKEESCSVVPEILNPLRAD